MPRVAAVDPTAPDGEIVAAAAAVLARGGLVGLPTETVYGLAALGTDPAAVSRVFAAKGRPDTHPLILHVDSEAMARRLVAAWPSSAHALASALWPGPLTLVLPKSPLVPSEVTGGGPTVALRMPAHPVALAVIRALGAPVAAPSANRYQTVSPTRAEHVVRSLGESVDLVLDAGPCRHGLESTVVDLSVAPVRVLRPGAVSLAALRAVVPELAFEPVAHESGARRSPGTDARHYAPAGRVVWVHDARDVGEAARRASEAGERAFAIARTLDVSALGVAGRTLGDEPAAYGASLYDALHEADAEGASVVLIESVPETEEWLAVRDRLTRAGGPRG